MKSTLQKFGTSAIRFAALAVLAAGVGASRAAAQGAWTGDADRAAGNTDAGGSVDCPDQYGASRAAAQGAWTGDVDWAAGNTDAGGSVDCPDQYAANNVWYAAISGGRAAGTNQALFDVYHSQFDQAFD
jgi:hypothetical protein